MYLIGCKEKDDEETIGLFYRFILFVQRPHNNVKSTTSAWNVRLGLIKTAETNGTKYNNGREEIDKGDTDEEDRK